MRAVCITNELTSNKFRWWWMVEDTEQVALTEGKTYQIYPAMRYDNPTAMNRTVYLLINDLGKLQMFPIEMFTKPWEDVVIPKSNEGLMNGCAELQEKFNEEPIEPGPTMKDLDI